jgi:hypothetical protein
MLLKEVHNIIDKQYGNDYKIVSGYELETDDIANMLAMKNNSILISEEGTSVNINYESNSYITLTDYVIYISLKDFDNNFKVYREFINYLIGNLITIDEEFYRFYIQKINKTQKEKLVTIYLQIIES